MGAGRTESEAEAPAIIELGQGRRVVVHAWGDESSGVLDSWAAESQRGGVNFLHNGITTKSAEQIVRKVAQVGRCTWVQLFIIFLINDRNQTQLFIVHLLLLFFIFLSFWLKLFESAIPFLPRNSRLANLCEDMGGRVEIFLKVNF